MKQKIVIKMSLKDDICRSKALKIAVSIPGVESAGVTGERKDHVEVVGEYIDSVELTRRLRKKFGCAELTSVGATKNEKNDVDVAKPLVVGMVAPPQWVYSHYHCYDVRDEPTCTIM